MVLLIVLGIVGFLTLGIIGVLFYMLSKESKKEEPNVVPVTNLVEIKNEGFKDTAEVPLLKIKVDESQIISPQEPIELEKINITSAEDEAYRKRAQQLEDELLAIAKKADGQSDEAKRLIESLREENTSLKEKHAEVDQIQKDLFQFQKEVSVLKGENLGLQIQLETSTSRMGELESQMTAVKIQMQGEIEESKRMIEQLRLENETLKATPSEDPQVKEAMEVLKNEHEQLLLKYQDLDKAHQSLVDAHAQLTEKNGFLEYELIKARAQSSGLERVSFNYKNQLEDFFKKINAVEISNEHLSQVKNRLEGMIEAIKSEHEDLIKKDQLAQFEIEKNRSRLQSLERENEALKAKIK